MTMKGVQAVWANVWDTARQVKMDLTDWAGRREPSPPLDSDERRHVAALREHGYVVLPNFWRREDALAMKDRLEAYLADGRNQDYECGAYLRFWDDRSYDQGVRRLYHVDKLVGELATFRSDPRVMRLAEAHYGRPFHSALLAFQHNTRWNADTRSYHVDGFIKQFKAFLYLEDVTEGNGPFTYLRGTHRSHLTRLKKQVLGNCVGSPTSFYEADLGPLLAREAMIGGEAGTLILADVRGFHRGSPQIDAPRSVLVNYLYREPGERFLDQ